MEEGMKEKDYSEKGGVGEKGSSPMKR